MPSGTSPLLAAGGVLVRRRSEGDVEVAVVHRPKRDDWSLPKGKAMPGEPLMLTARREVQEETGSLAPLGMPLPGQRYVLTSSNARVVKDVRYWAMWDGEGEFRPGPEVDELRWLGLAAARKQLSYARDVTVLDALAAVPGPTSTVVLTRACGTQRKGGRLRLDETGRQRARLLSVVLPALGQPTLLAVSDRSAATLAPAGGVLGADCTVTPEHASAAPHEALSALVNEARAAPVVLSAPDSVVGDLLVAALRRGELSAPGSGQLRTRRGGLWILSWYADALVGVQCFPSLAAPALPELTLTVATGGALGAEANSDAG
jgi:8-oxo-(d)GTP phosphatase